MVPTPIRRSSGALHVAFATPIAVVATVLLGVLAACGGSTGDASGTGAEATSTMPATTAVRPSATVDELAVVSGARLHVRCSGAGDTTVVLIAGFGGTTEHWAAIEPSVSKATRVCAYDRFGTGTSDPPPAPQTFATQAKDLRTLLRSIREPGPYVVVGHSFGGAEAVTFASLYPDDVRGLLLLEASPVTWNAAICAVADNGSAAAGSFRDACAMQADPAKNPEHLAGPAAFAQVATITSLDALPMIVATAPDRGPGVAGLPASDVAALNAAWDTGQDHWVSLSSAARLVTVADTGHFIQVDQPGVVLDQIRQLLR